jgi:hypothetical protein
VVVVAADVVVADVVDSHSTFRHLTKQRFFHVVPYISKRIRRSSLKTTHLEMELRLRKDIR